MGNPPFTAVLLDSDTFMKLEQFAKEKGLTTYGDAVKKMLEEVS